MMTGLRTVVAALQLSSIAFLVGCADPSGPAAPPAASLDLGAASLHLAVGQRLELPVEVRDARGNLLPDAELEWGTSDSAIVSIGGSGAITALGPGSAAVTATVDSVVRQVAVTVYAEGLHAWPDTMTLLPDDTGRVAARALSHKGAPVLLSAATWESSDPGVATVDSGGTVTAVAPGHTTITATAGDAQMESEVHVFTYAQPLRFASVSVGESQACGVTAGGDVYCWGMGRGASFGTDGPTDRCEWLAATSNEGHVSRETYRCSRYPVRVSGDHHFTSVSVGSSHACGIAAPTAVYCWGWNGAGVVNGMPQPVDVNVPTRVGGDIEFRSVSAGAAGTCAISTANQAYCWGENEIGLLGSGSTTPVLGPSPVSGGLSMSTVAVGFVHACGVTLDGDAYCWGRSVYGELGNEGAPEECGSSGSDCSTRPVQVSGTREFSAIAAGTFFTCGLTPSDGAFCWGDGYNGKLGDGRVEHSRTPVAVTASLTFMELSAGGGMTCALDQGGSTFCWGRSVLHATGERPATTEIPTRSAPEARLGSIDVGSTVCGIRSDGITVCRAEGIIEVVPGQ